MPPRLLSSLAVAAALLVTAPAGADVSTIPSTYPGADLAPIRAMSYQPAPSNYTPGSGVFFDTDFFNDDFTALWSSANGGRGDLATMAADGVNMLHLYDWNPQRDHLAFLNAAQAAGISVAVPISNYFVANDEAGIASVVQQVYVNAQGAPSPTPHPAVTMLTLGNEYEISGISAGQMATAAAAIVAAEQAAGATTVLPLAVPVSFGLFGGQVPGVVPTQAVMSAFVAQPSLGQGFVTSRFVAATNPQNPGSYLSGPVNGASDYYAAFAAAIPDTPLWFSEMGTGELLSCTGYPQSCTPGPAQQATFNADQFAAAVPGSGGILLGGTQFELEDEEWKGNPASTNDSTFGVYTFPWPAAAGTPTQPTTAPNGASGTFFVDPLTAKPSLASMRDAFSGTWHVAGSSGAAARQAGDGVALDPRDVMELDRSTGRWSTLLDGSKHGLRTGNGLAAVTTAADGRSLLLGLERPARLRGAGRVVPNDVVRYDLRTKRFSKVMHVGGAPIDAIAETPAGGLMISREGSGGVLQRTGDRWERLASGRELGLTRRGEDVDALWASADGQLYVSTRRAARTGTVKTGGADVLALSRHDGRWHARVVMRASAHGLAGGQLHGFAIAG